MSTKSRKLRFFSLFWDYASALSLIALLVLLWHLGKGPVKVNFLRPYIIQALTNETADYDLSVGSVNLELVHSVQPVKIIAKDVQFKDKEGEYLVEAPRLSLSFSARALLKGMLAPSSITIERPRVQITASYGLKGGEDETDAVNADTAGADENGAAGAAFTASVSSSPPFSPYEAVICTRGRSIVIELGASIPFSSARAENDSDKRGASTRYSPSLSLNCTSLAIILTGCTE